jgi:predicted nucleotidyltransferase
MSDDALRRAVDELTLRDHFASVALTALLKTQPADLILTGPRAGRQDYSDIARVAYDVAAAMLKERAARATDDDAG